MRYLVTGHTGFKGAWLTLLLQHRGHEVCGIALDPVPGSLFDLAGLSSLLVADERVDVRDAASTAAAVHRCQPEVVIHLAAQALVREGYRDPRTTYETNVMGTYNVLEATAATEGVRGIVVVTTDKVYRNDARHEGYREADALGGVDPYSASKAMADILATAWASQHDLPMAVARAGNVIGGGDVCRDRLLPDVISALAEDRAPVLRYPAAVRPWQHVLDCLAGYLDLTDAVLAGTAKGAWNFGPDPASFMSVGDVANRVAQFWGSDRRWEQDEGANLREAQLLLLDSSKARRTLQWRERLTTDEAIGWTVDWAKLVVAGSSPLTISQQQIANFEAKS